MQDKYITVTGLTKYIKYKIDTDINLTEVFLKGEISNFKAHTRGHLYFTIKDDNSRINAIMFASQAAKLKFLPTDGMKIMVTGKVSVYEATGGYQIYVNTMIEDGIGNLYIAYEQLKEKLEKEGLFNPEFKKTIPKIPKTIGIITAPTGAAIKDILSTIKRRWPLANTILFPALVQGKEASSSVAHQIEIANTYPLDVLIIGRGGGSIEDLWCFNEEIVARAIFDSDVPIISAVGHEIDFTIADFVADMRAPTPTGAAEMAVPNKKDIEILLNQITLRLNKALLNNISNKQFRLKKLSESYIMKNPLSIYQIKEQNFDNLFERLTLNMTNILERNNNRLAYVLNNNIMKNPTIILDKSINKYSIIINKLEALNPLLTLKRGYAIVKNNNKVITSVKSVKENDNIAIEVTDGVINAKVAKGE